MQGGPFLEVCVDSIEGIVAAQNGGAHRVELCANLLEGGTTPSPGLVELARKYCEIPLHVMVRPRGGDFFYSELEYEVMRREILIAKNSGVDGIVFGILDQDGSVDAQRSAQLVDLARPLSITFHRAFDMSADASSALGTLIDLGVDRILTSGQRQTAYEGLGCITELVRLARDRVIIMAGGGIKEQNVAEIMQVSGVWELHVSGRSAVESRMRYRNTGLHMGGSLPPEEYSVFSTDVSRIRGYCAAMNI